jgi:hypothetical protein
MGPKQPSERPWEERLPVIEETLGRISDWLALHFLNETPATDQDTPQRLQHIAVLAGRLAEYAAAQRRNVMGERPDPPSPEAAGRFLQADEAVLGEAILPNNLHIPSLPPTAASAVPLFILADRVIGGQYGIEAFPRDQNGSRRLLLLNGVLSCGLTLPAHGILKEVFGWHPGKPAKGLCDACNRITGHPLISQNWTQGRQIRLWVDQRRLSIVDLRHTEAPAPSGQRYGLPPSLPIDAEHRASLGIDGFLHIREITELAQDLYPNVSVREIADLVKSIPGDIFLPPRMHNRRIWHRGIEVYLKLQHYSPETCDAVLHRLWQRHGPPQGFSRSQNPSGDSEPAD